MKLEKLSNNELVGAIRMETRQKQFVDLAKEFVSRYVNGEMVDGEDMKSASDAAFDSGYEQGFKDGQSQQEADNG